VQRLRREVEAAGRRADALRERLHTW
jgi:hypothetical protein